MIYGHVYGIVYNEKIVYVGVTTDPIKRRFSRHKSDAKNNDDSIVHRNMREKGIDNFTIKPIRILPKCLLRFAEMIYIVKYKTLYPLGLNTNFGGYGADAEDDILGFMRDAMEVISQDADIFNKIMK